VKLQVSLHTTTTEARKDVVRGGTAPLEKIIPAAHYFLEHSGRKLDWNYVLTAGANDTPTHAAALIALNLRGRVKINTLNPVRDSHLEASSEEVAERFCAFLQEAGVNYIKCRTFGGEVEGACGQLHARTSDEMTLAIP